MAIYARSRHEDSILTKEKRRVKCLPSLSNTCPAVLIVFHLPPELLALRDGVFNFGERRWERLWRRSPTARLTGFRDLSVDGELQLAKIAGPINVSRSMLLSLDSGGFRLTMTAAVKAPGQRTEKAVCRRSEGRGR